MSAPVSHRRFVEGAVASGSASGPCASLFVQDENEGETQVVHEDVVQGEDMPPAPSTQVPTTPTLSSATRRSPAPSPSPPPGIRERASRSAEPNSREKARARATAARPKARPPEPAVDRVLRRLNLKVRPTHA